MTPPYITPQRKGKITYPNDWRAITNKIIKARNESISNKKISTGLYVKSTYPHYTGYSKVGHIYTKRCEGFDKFVSDPDFEILYDEIKD